MIGKFLLLMLLVLLLGLTWQRYTIDGLQKDKANLEQQIVKQNDAIIKWQQTSNEQALKIKNAIAQANQENKQDQTKIRVIQDTVVDPTCEKSMQWLKDQLIILAGEK